MKMFNKIALVSTLLIMGTLSLVGCSSKPKEQVLVYNWGDYIDEEVNRMFEEETGIKVVYSQYATNEEMYAKLSTGTAQYDIAIPSDYMIEKMINEDRLEPIDRNLLPNYANIDERFRNLPFDPDSQYSVPYMWGTMGIVYNKTLTTDTIDSWADMWDPAYEGQVFMYDSERDSIMVALKKLGYSMNTRDAKELEAAKQELIIQKPNVKAYVGDEGKGLMENNEAALMLAWAGDAQVMVQANPDLDYALPSEGTNLFVDSIIIPKGAPNLENAHQYIDFLCRPEIMAMNAAYIGYSTPSTAARELLPEEIKNSKIAYPTEEETATMEMFNDPSDVIDVYSRMWTEVKAGK